MQKNKLKIKVYEGIASHDNSTSYCKVEVNYQNWKHTELVSRGDLERPSKVFDAICKHSEAPSALTSKEFCAALTKARKNAMASKLKFVTGRTGFFGGEFVTAHRTYTAVKSPLTRHTASYHQSNINHGFDKKTWLPFQKRLSKLCAESDYMLIATCGAFAGTVSAFFDRASDNPLFFLHGGTSTGKSTILEIASNLLPGGDETLSKNSETSSRGLEELLAKLNNTTAFFDELGKVLSAKSNEQKEQFIHFLSNGEGTTKSKNPKVQEQFPDAKWNLHMFAAGEDKFENLISKGGQNRGTSARLIQLLVSGKAGVFNTAERLEKSRRIILDELLNVANKHDGYAWHKFTINFTKNADKRVEYVQQKMEEFLNKCELEQALDRRRAEKFALLAATGELLIKHKYLKLPNGHAQSAIKRLYDGYINSLQSHDDNPDPIPFAQAVLSQLSIDDRIIRDKKTLKKINFKSDAKYYGFLKKADGRTKILLKNTAVGKIIKALDDNAPITYLNPLKKSGAFDVPPDRVTVYFLRAYTDVDRKYKDQSMLQCDLESIKQIVKNATS